jgi:hypothetical protein
VSLDPRKRRKFKGPKDAEWLQAIALSAVSAGDVVRVSSVKTGGAYFQVSPAIADGSQAGALAVATTSQDTPRGFCWIKDYDVASLDTSSSSEGDPVYLSASSAGKLSLSATEEVVGWVSEVGAQGTAFVDPSSAQAASAASGFGTADTLWVDLQYGDDSTAAVGRQDRPFSTIAAAIAASASGDVIQLRPGVYAEEGLILKANTSLLGDSWQNTIVGSASATSDILKIDSAYAANITIQVPSASGVRGVVHTAGTSGLYGCNIAGAPGGSGDGVYKTGTGKLIGGNIRNETGGLNSTFRVDSGVLALDDVHGPATADSVSVFLLAEGTARYQGQGFNCGNPNCTDAVKLLGTSTVLLYSPNIFNVSTAVHIAADGVEFTSTGGKIQAANLTYEVDLSLTGVGTRVESLATVLEPLFSFPPIAADNVDFVLSFTQLRTNTRPARRREIGQDLALGFPEKGSGLYVGKGASYGDGMVAVSSDSVGGNLTNVTAEAQSLDSSTFTFQGTSAGHCLYFASGRLDASGNPLKHWGAVIKQVAAGVGGEYAFEVWDGAAWSSVGVLAVGEESGYRYGDDVFLRANSLEDLRYGINSDTPWSPVAVGAFGTYYWVRVRIVTAPSTLPTWERWWLTESTLHVNTGGQITADGTAQWKQTLVGAGNVFASGGSTTQGSSTVGTGAGTWTHNLDNAKLNQNADTINTQFVIPDGVNTAFPVKFRVHYQFAQYSSAPTITGGILGVQREGVFVADPSGGLVPIPRTEALTSAVTTKAGQTTAIVPTATSTNKILVLEYGPYDISDLYAGDLVLFLLELTSDGGGGLATDVQIWAIEVEGTSFSIGDLI